MLFFGVPSMVMHHDFVQAKKDVVLSENIAHGLFIVILFSFSFDLNNILHTVNVLMLQCFDVVRFPPPIANSVSSLTKLVFWQKVVTVLWLNEQAIR